MKNQNLRMLSEKNNIPTNEMINGTETVLSKVFNYCKKKEVSCEAFSLKNHTIGELVVTSGVITACNPFDFTSFRPLTVLVPKGRFPLVLTVVVSKRSYPLVAFAMVKFSNKSVVRWDLAQVNHREPFSIKGSETSGNQMETHTGCFMDSELFGLLYARWLLPISSDDLDTGQFPDFFGSYFEYLETELSENPVDECEWANIELNPSNGANLIAFEAGLGDRNYSSYFGYDKSGEVVCLITDFELVSLDK